MGEGRGIGSIACSPIPSSRLEGWHKGPTDNYYDREYRKLLGAPLPRSAERGASPSRHIDEDSSAVDPKKMTSAAFDSPRDSGVSTRGCGSSAGSVSRSPREGSMTERDRKHRDAEDRIAGASLEATLGEADALALADADGGVALAIGAVGRKTGGSHRGDTTTESGWEDGRRRSPICEAAQLMSALVKQRVRTLAFCRTRKLTELTLRYGRQV